MNENEFYSLDLGITKCYLIKCLGGFLLVDTGYRSNYEKFLKRMREVNIDISQIKYILLTHHHDDHTGFVTKLVNQTGAKLIVHKNGVAPLQRCENDTMTPVNLRIKLILSLYAIFHRNFEYPPVFLKNDDIVISGDNYELLHDLGIDGIILYTPGHCKDSISVILKDGISFVGDAAMNFLRLTGIKYRPIFVENIQDVFESWQKIIEHGAKIIYPAHGSPFPAERLTIMRNRFSAAKW